MNIVKSFYLRTKVALLVFLSSVYGAGIKGEAFHRPKEVLIALIYFQSIIGHFLVLEVLLSMCGFYWLMNKELLWIYGKGRTELGEGKARLYAERKRVESERHHGAAARVRHAETLLVSHCHVVIYRLMEMG